MYEMQCGCEIQVQCIYCTTAFIEHIYQHGVIFLTQTSLLAVVVVFVFTFCMWSVTISEVSGMPYKDIKQYTV